MLPSFSRRVLALAGIVSGLVAVFLSEWGTFHVPDLIWKALAGLSVLSLACLRYTPVGVVDDQELRSVIGDRPVSTLAWVRGSAMAVTVVAAIPAILIAPFISEYATRHTVLVISGAALLTAVFASAMVELRYRTLIRRSGVKVITRG